mmetsp:Transcript_57594/g.178834  ORF Transcript_57594/g.178834 Transcript_57594/m.178834 type:complete len:268 (-) Transcript_57594:7-810(-)
MRRLAAGVIRARHAGKLGVGAELHQCEATVGRNQQHSKEQHVAPVRRELMGPTVGAVHGVNAEVDGQAGIRAVAQGDIPPPGAELLVDPEEQALPGRLQGLVVQEAVALGAADPLFAGQVVPRAGGPGEGVRLVVQEAVALGAADPLFAGQVVPRAGGPGEGVRLVVQEQELHTLAGPQCGSPYLHFEESDGRRPRECEAEFGEETRAAWTHRERALCPHRAALPRTSNHGAKEPKMQAAARHCSKGNGVCTTHPRNCRPALSLLEA